MMMIVGVRGAFSMALTIWTLRRMGATHLYGHRRHWGILTIRGVSGAAAMVIEQPLCSLPCVSCGMNLQLEGRSIGAL